VDLKLVLVINISPKPRININNIKPIMIYVSKIDGPVNAMLIAIGGAIGTGLFLGAGQTIALTGPSILLTYIMFCHI
jgi:hypothetical protein